MLDILHRERTGSTAMADLIRSIPSPCPSFQDRPDHGEGDEKNGADAEQQREWIVTNGLGGYASGTVCGVPTRRYHGLLIAALRTPLSRTMMLNQLHEQVVGADGEPVVPGAWSPCRPSRARVGGPGCRVSARDGLASLADRGRGYHPGEAAADSSPPEYGSRFLPAGRGQERPGGRAPFAATGAFPLT